jgi:hypothetical protein
VSASDSVSYVGVPQVILFENMPLFVAVVGYSTQGPLCTKHRNKICHLQVKTFQCQYETSQSSLFLCHSDQQYLGW